jgi:hypothetical protein
MTGPGGMTPAVSYLDGWYHWERDNYIPFRWMRREAAVSLPPHSLREGCFVAVPVFSPFDVETQVLSISTASGEPLRVSLRAGWHLYDFSLAEIGISPGSGSGLELRLAVEPVFPQEGHPGDGRELGAAIGAFEVHDDRRRHDVVHAFAERSTRSAHTDEASGNGPSCLAGDVRVPPAGGDGWYTLEADDDGPFRWMAGEAILRVPDAAAAKRYCLVPIFSNYNNLAQELRVVEGDRVLARLRLLKRWHSYSIALPARRGNGPLSLTLRLNRLLPSATHPDDARDLGVRVGTQTFHDDPERHALDEARYENDVLRQRELLAGAAVLSSGPKTLGIDLFGKCNIKPPCVYCPWDRMKALEGDHTGGAIDDTTLESYGPLFRGTHSLVNCSFGEPLLHPRLEQVLALVARHGQTIELSTNGQAFTPRTVRALAGAPVHLYVSLDAASASTYARLRNERWYEVVAGLLALREARLKAGRWPRLNIVFIPMRANRGDLEDCFKLCRLVDADALVLRPLLLEDSTVNVERNGYRFVYEQEGLQGTELAELFADCRTFADRYSVRVMTQFDFGKLDFGGLAQRSGSPEQR